MEDWLNCGRLIKRLHDEMCKNANNAMRSQDMTIAQLDALMELDSAPGKELSLKELEKRLHIAQSTTVGIITRLEQKGLAERFSEPSDRRVKLVRITQAGTDCLMAAKAGRAEAEAKLLHGLTATEQHIFFTLLKKVCDTLG